MIVTSRISNVLIFFCSDLIIRNLHNVSDTSYGTNHGIDLQMMELPAQERYIYFYIVVLGIGIKSPDFCSNLFFLQNLIAVVHKKFQ